MDVPFAECNGQLTVEVKLKSPSDVFLVDEANLKKYKSGQRFTYFGGHYNKTLVRITVSGHKRFYLIVRGSKQYKYRFI